MKNVLLVCALILSGTSSFAQYTEKNIEVGMTVKLAKCNAQQKAFESMDMYRKTRIPEYNIIIDTLTGDGVFENFFTPGDFDSRRLPCSYANQSYKVAALREFDDPKNKTTRRVMILYTKETYTMIWVEFDKALELKEIEF